MDAKSVMEEKLKQLGLRFVQRTAGELPALHALVERVRAGETAVIEELRHLAHRIHGTGATLGFTTVSTHAAEIERWTDTPNGDANLLAESAAKLQAEVTALEKV